MHDDYRAHLDTGDEHVAAQVLHDLGKHDHGRKGTPAFESDVAVTQAEGVLFAYADSLESASASARVLEEMAAAHGSSAPATIARWHPEEARWEPAEAAMPSTPEQHAAEQARLDALEAAQSAQEGAQWEVRIHLPSHGETVLLAEQLAAGGHEVKRRWRLLFVSLATERDAQELVDRLTAQLPEEAEIEVEGSEAAAVAWKKLHPFSFLGGLGN